MPADNNFHYLQIKMKKMKQLPSETNSQEFNEFCGFGCIKILRIRYCFLVTFNRPYKLINGINRNFKNANLMNTTKNIDNAVSI